MGRMVPGASAAVKGRERKLLLRAPVEIYRMSWIRCLLVLALSAAPGFAADSDWHIVKIDGRDYLPLQDVAKFYGFPNIVPPVSQILPANPTEPLTKKLLLDNGRQQLEVTSGDREITLNGVHQWLSFPVEAVNDQLVISRLDLAKTIEPMLRPQMITGLHPVDTVVLDAGHGGHDKGAVSIFGNEKDFALDVCQRAKALLESKGLRVVMTRSSDVFIPLEQRPRVANAIPNSIFVAMHFNCAPGNSDANGFEIFSLTPRGAPSMDETFLSSRDLRNEPGNLDDSASSALAASIYHAMLGNIPQFDRGIKHQRFAVIRLATVPAVLIEGGFVSSTSEVRMIANPAWRQKLAEAIVAGLENYKALAEHHVPPKVVADYRNPLSATGATAQTPSVITNPQAPKKN